MGEEDIKDTIIFGNFCAFAKVWLKPGGSVLTNMIVYYFRQFYPNAYKYQEQASDEEIEKCLEEWNKIAAKAEKNEFGMYIGLQLNMEYEKKLKAEEERKYKMKKTKMVLMEAKRTGKPPPMKYLKYAVEFGFIKLPGKKQEADVAKPLAAVSEDGGDKPKEDKKVEVAEEGEKKKKKKKKKKDETGDGAAKKKKKKKKPLVRDTSLSSIMNKSKAGSMRDLDVEDKKKAKADSVAVWKRGAKEEDDPEKKAKEKAPIKKKVKKKKKKAEA